MRMWRTRGRATNDEENADNEDCIVPSIFDLYKDAWYDAETGETRCHAAPHQSVGNITYWLQVPKRTYMDRPKRYTNAILAATLYFWKGVVPSFE